VCPGDHFKVGKILAQGFGCRVVHLAAYQAVLFFNGYQVSPVGLFVPVIKRQFMGNNEIKDGTAGDGESQTCNIDQGVKFLISEVPEYNYPVMCKHRSEIKDESISPQIKILNISNSIVSLQLSLILKRITESNAKLTEVTRFTGIIQQTVLCPNGP
jgi:hypothetical protein